MAVVYGSFTPQTALAETLAHAKYYSLPVQAAMPRTFVAIEFALELVLDLTDGRNRQALSISEKRLLRCDWRADVRHKNTPITQQVGTAAGNAGFEAIVVRSTADSVGKNLVLFVHNLGSSSRLKVLSVDRL